MFGKFNRNRLDRLKVRDVREDLRELEVHDGQISRRIRRHHNKIDSLRD